MRRGFFARHAAEVAMCMVACGGVSRQDGLSRAGGPSSDAGMSGGGMGNAGAAVEGCTKDTDCKGTRICESGRCVSSGQGGQGASGDRGAGGAALTGGRTGAGGATSGGRAALGGAGASGHAVDFLDAAVDAPPTYDGPVCGVGEKLCAGSCYRPSPLVGCGLLGCAYCTNVIPNNGVAICDNLGQCSFACLSGYIRTPTACVGAPTPALDAGM